VLSSIGAFKEVFSEQEQAAVQSRLRG
jgi:hypothetical protein